MKNRFLFRLLLASFALLVALSFAAAEPVSPAVAAQWADLPEYLALLQDKPRFKSPPRLIAGAPPRNPAFLEPGSTVSLKVIIAIDEHGEVVAARVAESNDPRVDPIAVEAIRRWKFAPAQGETGPIKCVAKLPVSFNGPPQGDQNKLNLMLTPFQYDVRGLGLHAPIQMSGPGAAGIKAGRVMITSAIDDTGAELAQPLRGGRVSLMRTAVGGNEPAVVTDLNISLGKPTPGATRLKTLTGTVELVIPGVDPSATVQVDQLTAKLNRPVESAELAAAGVTIIILDRERLARALVDANDPSGVRAFLTSPLTESLPGWKNPIKPEQMTDKDLAIAMYDPEGNLAGLEFQSLYGKALPYNHSGWSHFEVVPGRRISIYRLNAPPSDDIKLVCWLITPKSLVKYPLQMTDVPLPATK